MERNEMTELIALLQRLSEREKENLLVFMRRYVDAPDRMQHGEVEKQ